MSLWRPSTSRDVIDSLYYSLRDRLAGPRVYVAAEVRVYRDLAAVRARAYREPDLLVVLDRPDEQRLVYLLSDEGKAPDFVLEVLSDTTYQNDLGEKRRWYREIGVREYVVIDLEGAYVGERRLQRWRLEEEGPQSVAPPDVGLEGETITSLVLPYGLKVREALGAAGGPRIGGRTAFVARAVGARAAGCATAPRGAGAGARGTGTASHGAGASAGS